MKSEGRKMFIPEKYEEVFKLTWQLFGRVQDDRVAINLIGNIAYEVSKLIRKAK